MKIRRAQTKDEIEQVRKLFREYGDFLEVDLCFQGFDDEIAGLPGKYAPPDGELLVAVDAGRIVGCVAFRKLDDDVCEMKRLFVKPEARRKGVGRQLAEAIIAAARQSGYTLMRLDTLERLQGAMHLYETLGFHRTPPYYDNPLADVAYWALELNPSESARKH